MRTRILVLLALISLSCTACGGGSSSNPEPRREEAPREEAAAPEGETYQNPVYGDDFPDPFVLKADGSYHAYSTNSSLKNVQTLVSDDLVRWTEGEDAMPELASWVTPGNTWAPEVLQRDGRYVLYYTAADSDSGRQCLGRAVSDAPEGPFTDETKNPLVCQAAEGGSIDASPFEDENGDLYLYWKNDGNCCGFDTYIYARKLSPDGLSLVGEPKRLFKGDAGWEGSLVEAPFMWKHDGKYFLFYSANAFYDETYAVGYATCKGPLGSCEKAPENPILKTGEGAAGPGHNSIVEDGEGETWVAYHAWPPDAIGSVIPGRNFRLDRLSWESGKPVIKGPTARPQPAPR